MNNTLASLLEKLNDANILVSELRNKINVENGPEIVSRLRRYFNAWHYENCGYRLPSNAATFNWDIDSNGETVSFEWSDYWPDGDVEKGQTSLPVTMLVDNGTELANYEVRKQRENDALTAQKAEFERLRKMAEFEKLKKELGQ